MSRAGGERPRILVSNDDGHSSEGIRALADAMEPLGEVWVVAPDREQSAASHSLLWMWLKIQLSVRSPLSMTAATVPSWISMKTARPPASAIRSTGKRL